MPILKKPVKKINKGADNIPMFHDGNSVTFDDGDGNILKGVIETADADNETATVLVGEDQYEVEFKELTLAKEPAPKSTKKVPSKKEVEKPAKGGKTPKKGDAFAEQLRKTKAAAAGGFLADGDYEGLVVEINYTESDKDDKGDSVGIKYTVVNNSDDDLNGKSAVSFYTVTTPEGDLSQGMEFLKRDLIMMGLEEEEIDGVTDKQEFIDLLEKLGGQEVWVEFKVATRKGYANVFLQSVFDDQTDKPSLS